MNDGTVVGEGTMESGRIGVVVIADVHRTGVGDGTGLDDVVAVVDVERTARSSGQGAVHVDPGKLPLMRTVTKGQGLSGREVDRAVIDPEGVGAR